MSLLVTRGLMPDRRVTTKYVVLPCILRSDDNLMKGLQESHQL